MNFWFSHFTITSMSLFFVSGRLKEDTPNFISGYFKYKNIKSLILSTCSEEDAYLLGKDIIQEEKIMGTFHTPMSKKPVSFWSLETLKLGVYVDLDCSHGWKFLELVSNNIVMNITLAWLMSAEKEGQMNLLGTIPLSISSDVVVATSDFKLFDAYKFHPEKELQLVEIGNWTKSEGVMIQNKKRENLMGTTVKGSFVLTNLEVDPMNMSQQLQDTSYFPELDILNRYHYILHHTIARMYNYTLQETVTNTWGYMQPNGHFSGMIGQLENKTSEISLSPSQPRHDRLNVVDFVVPMHNFRLCFIFRQPNALGTYKALLIPLTPIVWLCVSVLICLSAVCFCIMNQFDKFKDPNYKHSFVQGLVKSIGILTQQGLSVSSSRLSNRILDISMLILGLMVYAYYNAAIMNGLLSPSTNVIKTVDQLVESPLKVGMLDIPYLFDRVTPQDPLTSRVYKKMMSHSNAYGITNLFTGIEKVRDGRYAFYAEDTVHYAEIKKTFTDSETCDLKEVEMLSSFLISCSVQKYSPFREILNRGILRMKEAGILYREDKVWYAQRPNCLGSQSILAVSFEAVTVANGAILLGIILSSVILLFENLLYKYKSSYVK